MTKPAIIQVIEQYWPKATIPKAVGAEIPMSCFLGTHEDKTPSMYINIQKGLFCCHSCHQSGNAYQLLVNHKGFSPADAMKALEQINPNKEWLRSQTKAVAEKADPDTLKKWKVSEPYKTVPFKKSKTIKMQLVRIYDYNAIDGTPIFKQCRYEYLPPDATKPEKDFRCFTCRHDGTFWIKGPLNEALPDAERKVDKYPLFRIDKISHVLVEGNDDQIWIVEGEKCAEIAAEMKNPDGYKPPVVSIYRGSATDFAKHDFAPLNGRKVCILGDRDTTSEKWVKKLAQYLKENHDCRIRMLIPHGDDKYDIGDAIIEGGSAGDEFGGWKKLTQFIQDSGGMKDYDEVFPPPTEEELIEEQTRKDALSVMVEGVFREMPSLTPIYEGSGKEPSYFATYDKKTGWVRHEAREMTNVITRIAEQLRIADFKNLGRIIASVTRSTISKCKRTTSVSDWDVGKNSIPLADGGKSITLRGAEIGEIIQSPKDDMMLLKLPVSEDAYEYIRTQSDADEKEELHALMNDWFPDDPDTQKTVQVLCGQALIGNPKEAIIYISGPGGTGKSFFLDLLSNTFGGEYAAKISNEYLLERTDKRGMGDSGTGLYVVAKARYLISHEIDSPGMKMRTGRLKDIASGDPMTVRRLYKEPIAIRPVAMPMIYGNFEVMLDDVGDSMKDRLYCIRFENKIRNTMKQLTDTEKAEKVERLMGAVLAWAIEGLRIYYAEGVPVSDKIAEDTSEYIRGQDWFMEALEAVAVREQGRTAEFAEIMRLMKLHGQNEGSKMLQSITTRGIGKQLTNAGMKKKRVGKGWVLPGWRCKTESEMGLGAALVSGHDDEERIPF